MSQFDPPWWLRNHHLQTLFPTFHRRRWQVETISQRLELPDGDFVDLSWAERPPAETTAPIIVLFHGLEGSAQSPYAKGMLCALRTEGYYPLVMHFRGCSGESNRLARGYHSGETGDGRFLLGWLAQHYPQAPLAAVGYSLGGNMLLKLQAELGAASPLTAAVSVCAPLQLAVCADKINRGFSRIYQRHLLNRMKRNLQRKLQQVDISQHKALSDHSVARLESFWQFDDHYTAPVHGFNDVHDYYQRSSARQYLKLITRPTLLIQAADDPFMTEAVLPQRHELGPGVKLEVSRHGGHVGFITGHPARPVYWLEQRVPSFFRHHFSGNRHQEPAQNPAPNAKHEREPGEAPDGVSDDH